MADATQQPNDIWSQIDTSGATAQPKDIWSQIDTSSQSTYDPSAGGGTLSIGPWDTGVHTPQWLDRTLSGAGEAGVNLARGAGQWVGLESRADVAEARQRDAALNATTAGKVGNVLGNIGFAAPVALIPGAGTVAGATAAGAGLGALQPSTSTEETLLNTGGGALLGGATGGAIKVGGKILGAVQGADTAIEQGHPLTIPAEQEAARIEAASAHPAASGIPAKDVTPLQNYVRTIAREDTGLPKNSPVTPTMLETAISKTDGPIYRAVESTPNYATGAKYEAALKGVDTSRLDPVNITNPDGTIRQIVMPKPGESISGADTLALSREYRERANMAYDDSNNPNLTSSQRLAARVEGNNYKAGAKAVEAGYSDAEPITAQKWDAARQHTAKLKAWESASDDAGNDDPTKIKRMVAGESITSPAMKDAATVVARSANKQAPPGFIRGAIQRYGTPLAAGAAAGVGGRLLGDLTGHVVEHATAPSGE